MDRLLFLGYEAAASVIPFAALSALHGVSKKKAENGRREPTVFAAAVFALYIAGVMHFTGSVTVYELFTDAAPMNRWYYNLIPFSNTIDTTDYLLNVFMLVPLGLLAPFFCEKARSFGMTLLLGAGFSVFIELSQLLNDRCTDIDDLIMNTIGAALGYLLFILLDDITEKKLRRNALSYPMLFIMILAVFAGRALFYNEMGLAKLLYDF